MAQGENLTDLTAWAVGRERRVSAGCACRHAGASSKLHVIADWRRPARALRWTRMWARVHKIDRIRPQPGGRAVVLVEDERTAAAMARVPSLSTVIAVARVLNARRALDARYAGKGEVRYAAAASLPLVLADAVTRAGASIADGTGERVLVPAAPASVSAVIDQAFVELAHHVRTHAGAPTLIAALHGVEASRREAPLDRDAHPAAYWPAVFELAALAGELSRSRGGRWIETTEMPVPFAIKLATGELAMPHKLAQRIVEGHELDASLASDAT